MRGYIYLYTYIFIYMILRKHRNNVFARNIRSSARDLSVTGVVTRSLKSGTRYQGATTETHAWKAYG